MVIDMLQEKVGPFILRKKIKDERKYWSKDERGSIANFKKHLFVQAIPARNVEVAIFGMKKNTKHDRHTCLGAEYKKIFKIRKYTEGSSRRGPSRDGESKQWTEGCLNPKCDWTHRLKYCTNTSPEEKKHMFKDFYDIKKNNKAPKAINAYTDIDKPTNGDEGCYQTIIEYSVPAIALGDTGADFSAMSAETAVQRSTADTTIDIKTFNSPMVLESAFKSIPVSSY